MTYGLVVAVTILAVVAYYFVARGKNPVEVKDDDKFGSVLVGSVWVPVYPGALLVSHTSSESGGMMRDTYRLKTKDPAEKLLSFYRAKLKSGRFWLNHAARTPNGGTLQASARGGKVQIFTTVTALPDGGAEGLITSIEKQPDK